MGLDPTIITAVISELEGSGQIGSESTRYEKIGYVTDAETNLEYSGDLVGLKVEDYCQGRRFAVADIPRPNLENGTALFMGVSDSSENQIAYSDYYGALDKPALLITGEIIIHIAPEAYAIDPRIVTLMYLYETTSDNMGLGITLDKGWYAINMPQEILVPLDLSKTPVRFYDSGLSALLKEEYIPIMEQHFPDKRETITYIVKPENVAEVYDPDLAEELRTNWHVISPFDVAGIVDACMFCSMLDYGASATYKEGALRYSYGTSSMTTFYKPVKEVKPIEGKYLPEGGVGYDESEVITYDGNGEKVDILGNGETYAKVSAEYVNGNNISKIVRAVAGNDGELADEVVYSKDELSIEVTDIATMVSYNDTLLVISAVADVEGFLEKGTYVLDKIMGVEGDKAYTWISSIEYGEVHPIDPKYLPKGGVGYGESKTITYDGTGEEVDLGIGAAYAKIQDQPIDLSKATKITIWQYEEGYTTIEGFEVQSQSGMQAIMKPGVMNDYIMVLSVSANEMGVPEGLYFADGNSIYISSLEYGEIKPIDPKYLYPRFDLTAMGLPAVPVTGNTAYCTADIAALYEAMKSGFVRVTATADLGGMEVPISAGLACTVMETDTVHGAQGSAVVNFSGAPACFILVAEDGELSANILMLGGGSSINLPNAEEASF